MKTRAFILIILAGVIYAAYTVFSKLAMDSDNDPKTVTLYCFLVASIISFSLAGPKEIITITAENTGHIVSLFGLGIATCILPFFFIRCRFVRCLRAWHLQ